MTPLKRDILAAVDERKVIHFLDLYSDMLAYDYKPNDIMQALSELVQENQLKRYEFATEGNPNRSQFYMPYDSKLMI